jgi:hypothetical protein
MVGKTIRKAVESSISKSPVVSEVFKYIATPNKVAIYTMPE